MAWSAAVNTRYRCKIVHTISKLSTSFQLSHLHFFEREDFLCFSFWPLLRRLLVSMTGGRSGCATAQTSAGRGGEGASSRYASSLPNKSSSLTYAFGRLFDRASEEPYGVY